MRCLLLRGGTLLCAACLMSVVHAGQVNSRAELQAKLFPGALTESFETFNANPNTNYAFPKVLNSTTFAQSQGPGLVLPGLEFSDLITNLAWHGEVSSPAR